MRVVTRNEYNYLFFDYDLRSFLESNERKMYDEIEGIEANRLRSSDSKQEKTDEPQLIQFTVQF